MTVLPNPDYLHHPKFKAAADRIEAQTPSLALQKFLPAFQRTYLDWLALKQPDLKVEIEAGGPALSSLQETGFARLSIDAGAKGELCALCEPVLAPLEAKLRDFKGKPKFRDMNLALTRSDAGRVYALVDQIFRDLDVFAVGEAYLRRPLKTKTLYVQLNTAEETAARYGPIESDGLPALKTDYWHIDSDVWPCVKVIIYLSPVELDQGPLRYVVGSHRRPPSFETVVRKTNDTLKLPAEQFLALPDEFRMHALFGPFLTGDEPQVEDLLERERPIYGEGGELIVFDNNGVHRGGFVRSGERRIVQCLFEAR
jgi:hypothetical protein